MGGEGADKPDMKRTDIINFYLSRKSYPTCYLEVGVQNPIGNFDKIQASFKDGVDPSPVGYCRYVMTSDSFFRQNQTRYDVIFIDGCHLYEQVYRDMLNSLDNLKPDGIILMHDCNPETEWHQREDSRGGPWNGTVWKAFVRMRQERSDVEMFVVDTDYGVGVIDPKGKQVPLRFDSNIYDYTVFNEHRREALNLITVEEWNGKYCSIPEKV